MHGIISSSGGGALPIEWNIQNAGYSGKSVNITTANNNPYGIMMSPDGMYMYHLGTTSRTIYRWTLGTAWDISTAMYDGLGKALYMASRNTDSCRLDPTGTKLFVSEYTSSPGPVVAINYYLLGTAWDVNSAPASPTASFSVATENTISYWFNFKPDGTKLYTYSSINKRVYQYGLGVAWDITTASYDSIQSPITSTLFAPTSQPMQDFSFSTDGKQAHFNYQSNRRIYQAELTSAWDITSMVDTLQVHDYLSDGFVQLHGIGWKPDGLSFYMTGTNTPIAANGSVVQYDLT